MVVFLQLLSKDGKQLTRKALRKLSFLLNFAKKQQKEDGAFCFRLLYMLCIQHVFRREIKFH